MKNINEIDQTLKSLLDYELNPSANYFANILCSPSDIGVIRNSGRNGSRYAPEAILNRLKKFNNHLERKNENVLVSLVTTFEEEKRDYVNAREKAIQSISKNLISKKTIHIGGGHDHIYSLLMAIDKDDEVENIILINIDAHCDTRISNSPNSGTPFRDYDRAGKKPFHLIQYGLQDYSNSKSTLSKLERGTEEKHFIEAIENKTKHFTEVDMDIFTNVNLQISERTAIVFSLDCDGIDGSNMRAVSAVNPRGIPAQFVEKIACSINKKFSHNKKYFGLYEFNPIFEDHSLYSTKVICSLIYNILKFK